MAELAQAVERLRTAAVPAEITTEPAEAFLLRGLLAARPVEFSRRFLRRVSPYPTSVRAGNAPPASCHLAIHSSSDKRPDRRRPGRSAKPRSPAWPGSLHSSGLKTPHRPTSATKGCPPRP